MVTEDIGMKKATDRRARNGAVFVTGVAGFIGGALAKRLLQDGYRVVGIDNLNTYYSPRRKAHNLEELLLHPEFTFVYTDLKDYKKLAEIFSEHPIRSIVHLAARAGVRPSIEKPLWYDESNITGTLHLLELAVQHGVEHFVFASSSSVYGEQESRTWSEGDTTDMPISPYAATKKATELISYTYHHLFGFPVTGLRFFTVYGPGNRPDMAMHKFADAILHEKELEKFGDGSSVRTYVYIDDVVEGIVRALENPDGYQIYNLGGGERITLNELISAFETETGKSARIREFPEQPGDVTRIEADYRKANEELGWEPKISFRAGVAKLVTWLKEELVSERAMPRVDGVTKDILIFSNTYHPYVAAAETAVKEITGRLDQHRYTMITGRFSRDLPVRERIGSVEVHRIGFGNRYDRFWYPIAALWYALQLPDRFDIAWAIGASSAGIPAAVFSQLRPTRLVLSLQETREKCAVARRMGLLFPFLWFVYRKAYLITAVSGGVAKQARRFGRGDVRVVPNGVLLGECRKTFGKEYLANKRRELGSSPEDVVCLTGFMLGYENGIDVAIRALSELPAPYKLLVAGQGPERERLIALAEELGVSNRVVFTPVLDYGETVEFLKLADVFVRPARAEGVAMDFLQAMLCGIPVVGTRVGGLAEILKEGETALTCLPEDPKRCAEAVRRITEDESLRAEIVRKAKHISLREYDWEIVTELMKEVFDRVPGHV